MRACLSRAEAARSAVGLCRLRGFTQRAQQPATQSTVDRRVGGLVAAAAGGASVLCALRSLYCALLCVCPVHARAVGDSANTVDEVVVVVVERACEW